MEEYLLAAMAVAASQMEAAARIQKEVAAALQSLAAHREHDVVSRQLRRVEKAISVLTVFPDERDTPLDSRGKTRRLPTNPGRGRPLAEPLTEREIRVLEHLRGTQTLGEIARDLNVSKNTIKSHTKAIYRKLGAANRGDATRCGKELGILL